jgi:hypothetical protein
LGERRVTKVGVVVKDDLTEPVDTLTGMSDGKSDQHGCFGDCLTTSSEFRFRLNGEIMPEIFIQRALVDGEPVGEWQIVVTH